MKYQNAMMICNGAVTNPGTYRFSLHAQKICQIPLANMTRRKDLAKTSTKDGLRKNTDKNSIVKRISNATKAARFILHKGHLFSKRVNISSNE
jgi:hypothetical protein